MYQSCSVLDSLRKRAHRSIVFSADFSRGDKRWRGGGHPVRFGSLNGVYLSQFSCVTLNSQLVNFANIKSKSSIFAVD